MDATATPTSTPNGPPVVLDDEPAPDRIGDAAPPVTETPEKPAEPVKDADEMVVELSRRTREAQNAHKAATAKQKELDTFIGKHKAFESVLALAKTDPIGFFEQMADAAGLDYNTAWEAWTARKSGGSRELTAEERVKRLEAERDRERSDAEQREAAAKAERDKADGDAAVQRHREGLKAFAKASEANFPLFNDDADVNAEAAFDLMVLAHEAGKSLTYAAAVHQIETTLFADTERRASRLGFAKPTSSTPTQTTPTPTAPQAQPRQTQAHAAPIEATSTIRSDDEIAADWINTFQRRN